MIAEAKRFHEVPDVVRRECFGHARLFLNWFQHSQFALPNRSGKLCPLEHAFKLHITICNGKGESGKISRKAWTT